MEILKKLAPFWKGKIFNKTFGPEGPEIDKDAAELVKVAQSVEYNLWLHYNAVCVNYMAFVNSGVQKDRQEYLREVHDAAARLGEGIRKLCWNSHIPTGFIKTIKGRTFPNLDNLYLNLTQLFMLFMNATTIEAKVNYLTPMYWLCEDLKEITLVTDTEPNRLLEPFRK